MRRKIKEHAEELQVGFVAIQTLFIGLGLWALHYGASQIALMRDQMEQASEHRRWQNYNDLNLRYAELYRVLPAALTSGRIADFARLPPNTKRWVRQYFDLTSEEYWLFREKLIPAEMWTKRIHNGLRVNLRTYPAIVDGYGYWRSLGAFSHPAEFNDEIKQAMADVEIKCDRRGGGPE